MCFIVLCSGSEEQSRAHSRQEAREEARYVLVGTSQAGALQDPVASPARYHLHSACHPSPTLLLATFWVPVGVASNKLSPGLVDFF